MGPNSAPTWGPFTCRFPKKTGKYSAQIQRDGKITRLGTFDTAIEAARAYDAKALELFGQFARLNLPQEHECPTQPQSVARQIKVTQDHGSHWPDRTDRMNRTTSGSGKRSPRSLPMARPP
ncbi:MAG: hypothetical protein JW955_16340 [Sedimentisphaerales bacterium]|nr:hypothetical protein [Sedimentisphaerales bacterium]